MPEDHRIGAGPGARHRTEPAVMPAGYGPPEPPKPRGLYAAIAGLTALVLALAAAVVFVLLRGDDSGHPAAAPSPDRAANEGACRAFDDAVRIVHDSLDIGTKPIPAAIVPFGKETAEKITTASKLAQGEMRTAMEKAALTIQILTDKEESWESPGFDNAAEARDARAAVLEVGHLCNAIDVIMENQPN